MRPNIVLILIDDLGWKDLGCTGSRYYQTPHIDRLASEGMLFTQAYAAAPICSPSRGALYSGQYPARSKFTAVIRPYVEPDSHLHEVSKPVRGNLQHDEALHRHCLPPDVPTIAELLKPAGYRTGLVGKWHCGWNEAHWPDKRGWDVAEGFRTLPAATKGHFGRDFIPYKCKGLDDLRDDDYMTDVLTDRAVAFLNDAAERDQPFHLTLSHYAVHTKLDAPDDLIEKYRRLPTTDQDNPVYAAMIEKVDQSVGRIVETLDALGISDNTMVVFTSDNGGLSPDATSNYPLMGGKSFCYEAGMRVPLIIKWPARVPADRREATRTVSVDLTATWLAMAGVDVSDRQPRRAEPAADADRRGSADASTGLLSSPPLHPRRGAVFLGHLQRLETDPLLQRRDRCGAVVRHGRRPLRTGRPDRIATGAGRPTARDAGRLAGRNRCGTAPPQRGLQPRRAGRPRQAIHLGTGAARAS
jgi:arylsulfatase A